MRCDFVEIQCELAAGFVCLQCKRCSKRLNVAVAMRDKLHEMTVKFHACSSAAAPAEQSKQPEEVWDPAGAGTQLKKLLSKLGIKVTANCTCNARARIMNEHGIEWCEQNVANIIGWLKEEATRRRLPFLAFPTKILVERAIKIAKRVREKAAVTQEDAATT